ncbi:DNA repair protein RAD5 [Trichoderma ghanense]|uniref:DNA repair protein RAD5 n=1 Tax=Trichoderma ghanense TaxID=65468 RepID=A0ABY2H0I1_9HYPO
MKAGTIMDPEPKPPHSPGQPVPLQQPSPAPSKATKSDEPEVAGKPNTFTIRGDTPSDHECQDTTGKSHTEINVASRMVAKETKCVSAEGQPAQESDVKQEVSEILQTAISGDLQTADIHLSEESEHPNDKDGSYHVGDGVASDHENGADNGDGSDHDDGSEFQDGSDSSNSRDEEGNDKPRISSKKPKTNQPRRKVALNAREYVARMHEEEDNAYAKKMEEEENSGSRPGKRKATELDEWPRKASKAGGMNNVSSFGGGASGSDANLLPAMEPIKARTHAEQFARLKAQIPHNCDTRRRKTQNQDLHEAAKLFGYKRVEAENGRWKLKGMKTSLEGHQLTAVSWMVKRELARGKPYGGLLADSMGMGKTVMSLACIVGNQADSEHRREYCNATLVVVQNKTDAEQWESEAHKHCKDPVGNRVFVYDPAYHGLRKCKQSYIIITTYKELLSQYPSKRILGELRERFDSDDTSYERELRAMAGPLFNIKWYRVILDEAHAIKNVESRTAQACCAILGKYRWALSGTPLANTSDEMYPYLKFTECESTWSLRDFRKMYTKYGKVNGKFEALVSHFMLRRTLKDDFLGRKIIDLPEQREADLLVPLSAEEQVIVNAVKKFYKNKLAELQQGTLAEDALKAAVDGLEEVDGLQQGATGQAEPKAVAEIKDEADKEEQGDEKAKSAARSARNISWRLGQASQVRKRQTISHAFSIELLLRHSFNPDDLEDLRKTLKEVAMKRTILEQISSSTGTHDGISRYEKGLRELQQREEAMFGKYFDMDELLTLARDERAVKGVTCRLCKEATPPVQPRRLPKCNHIFCGTCLCTVYANSFASDQKPACPNEDCKQKFTSSETMVTLQSRIGKRTKEYCEPGKDSNGAAVHRPDDRNGFFICGTMLDGASVVPSTKLTAAMAVVLTWLHEAPDDKILVFTQFTGTAKILGYMLQTLGIGFVYYYGGLPLGLKRRALDSIKTKPDVKVMVSTLKAGGQCLNLTVANRVVIIDPWWNKTAEQQAFGRVTRMGQEKVTHLVNIRTAEEIDERIHTLQKKKAKDVDYALQDDGHTPPAVSEIELQQAFFRTKSEEEEKKKERKRKAPATKKTTAAKKK